jgi:hypothetical protein
VVCILIFMNRVISRNIRYIPIVSLIIILAVSVIHLLYGWIISHGDSYYYLSFAEYIRTGKYPFQYPFLYTHPPTLNAPFYSLILTVIQRLSHGDVWLHIVQLILLLGSTGLVYSMLTGIVGKIKASVLSLLFFIFPVHLIYVSYVMTEILAEFLFALYLILFISYIKFRKQKILALSLIIAAVLTLTRYQYAILFAVSIGLIVWSAVSLHKLERIAVIGILISTTIIASWVYANYRITGTIGLSDTTKLRFQVTMIYDGKYFPPEDDPAVRLFRKYVPASVDKYLAWWDLQGYVLPYVGYDWRKMDEIVGGVGWASVKRWPIQYLLNGIRIGINMHLTVPPWWRSVGTFGEIPDPNLPVTCDHQGTIYLCNPIINSPKSYPVWNSLVRIWTWIYKGWIPTLAILILFPAIILGLFTKDKLFRSLTILYILIVYSASLAVNAVSRILIPVYPLIIIICVMGIKEVIRILKTLPRFITLFIIWIYSYCGLIGAWIFTQQNVMFHRTDPPSILYFIPPFIRSAVWGDYTIENPMVTTIIWITYIITLIGLLFIAILIAFNKKVVARFWVIITVLLIFICFSFLYLYSGPWTPSRNFSFPIDATYILTQLSDNYAIVKHDKSGKEDTIIIGKIQQDPAPFLHKRITFTPIIYDPQGIETCSFTIQQCINSACHLIFPDLSQIQSFVCAVDIQKMGEYK